MTFDTPSQEAATVEIAAATERAANVMAAGVQATRERASILTTHEKEHNDSATSDQMLSRVAGLRQ
jgi:hypothetical protein